MPFHLPRWLTHPSDSGAIPYVKWQDAEYQRWLATQGQADQSVAQPDAGESQQESDDQTQTQAASLGHTAVQRVRRPSYPLSGRLNYVLRAEEQAAERQQNQQM